MDQQDRDDIRQMLKDEVGPINERLVTVESQMTKVWAFAALGRWLLPLAMMTLLTASSLPDDARSKLMTQLVQLLK